MEENKESAYFFEKKLKGQRIKEIRLAKNISLGKLSWITGIDPADISKLEKGYCNTTDENNFKIFEGLGVTIFEFYNWQTFNQPIIKFRIAENSIKE
jgi:transcriptional regulator with XRE-family HTH domain